MSDVMNIIKSAENAIDIIENGKTYPSNYIVGRFNKAAEENPGDQLISHMRDVIGKVSKNRDYFTQNEVGRLYDEMYGLSGGRSAFRGVLGDLIPEKQGGSKSPSYLKNRIDITANVDPIVSKELSGLADELSSVFSLDAHEGPGLYSASMGTRVERMVHNQLSSLGCRPDSVTMANRNKHFVLCIASYNMPDFTNVNLKIPVQISNNVVKLPTKMIQADSLVDMTKESIYVHLKDSSNRIHRNAHNKFASERKINEFREEPVVVPRSLEKYADLENDLVAAMSHFNKDEINRARNVVVAELASVGIANPQVKVSSSDDKLVNFTTRIPTNDGGVDIKVPMEIHGGVPTMPSRFIVSNNGEERVYKFNKSEIQGLATPLKDGSSIVRDSGELRGMSYHELIDRMIGGVSEGDYRMAEDSLAEINERFDSDHYITALDKFSLLLKASSSLTSEDALVKNAVARGDLIEVPTSIELYCPKLGLPLRKISFDSNGKPIPKNSSYKIENLKESGSHISTSKIILT